LEILGISGEPTLEEVKAAFRKAVKEVHPDSSEAISNRESKFVELTNAYKYLLHRLSGKR
ncbi:MAG: molecular chaperone DnaJ, partial [Candidatus Dadabacteria bacterium]